jgi:hypothetical protein
LNELLPDDELAEPVLARSSDEAEDVAEETAEEPRPEEKPCEYPSRPWSLPALSPQRASAPLSESMEGVGDAISPDFCLTMPVTAGAAGD